MNSKKTKEDADKNVLRVPKQKKRLGLFVPEINLPHLELVKPENAPPETPVAEPTQTRQTRQTTQTTQTRQTTIAPERNYQKVPNSITKEAIPAGLFKGKSKQLYDVLYSLTRGAIVPTRSIRIRKGELMKKADIGSRITFDSNIAHLQIVGLIRETIHAGEHAGNEFEVLTVEEIATLPSQTTVTSLTNQSQKLDRLVSLESSLTRQGLNDVNEEVAADLKPFFKTLSFIDDEAPLIAFVEKLNAAVRAATGKDLTSKDLAALDEIAELIINETTVARAKTKSISVYLKFAAENLRRRLYAKQSTLPRRLGTDVKSFSEPVNTFEAEPLGKEREMILDNLRKIVEENGIESIEIFRENYTEGDWKWITENLKN
jgi:hypothetical protein